MSWRENLGINSNTQYPQNTQKSTTNFNFAHIAERKSKLLEILSPICHGLSITPQDVFNARSQYGQNLSEIVASAQGSGN